MVTLRDRFGIRSHHIKAQRLGTTWVRSGFASVDTFGQTLLGQWLQGLGLAISRENLSETPGSANEKNPPLVGDGVG